MHWFSFGGLVTVELLKSCCASATNKRLNRDKLQLAGSAALHIIANNNLPIKRALFGTTKSAKYLFVKAVFSKLIWWVTPQFSPDRFGYYR